MKMLYVAGYVFSILTITATELSTRKSLKIKKNKNRNSLALKAQKQKNLRDQFHQFRKNIVNRESESERPQEEKESNDTQYSDSDYVKNSDQENEKKYNNFSLSNGRIYFENMYIGESYEGMSEEGIKKVVLKTSFFSFKKVLTYAIWQDDQQKKETVENFLRRRIGNSIKFSRLMVTFQRLNYCNPKKIGELSLAHALLCIEYAKSIREQKRTTRIFNKSIKNIAFIKQSGEGSPVVDSSIFKVYNPKASSQAFIGEPVSDEQGNEEEKSDSILKKSSELKSNE
ncbi:MAG TPA: hypothetical protein VEK38_00470 [Candidatus Bathyarchaeia archaeon]|nr:hypothetical protein [Candidatus Bathyarchaeia archaeon]